MPTPTPIYADFAYTGDLKQDISDMDFADDLPDDDNEERFRKHNHFLRTLKEDLSEIFDEANRQIDVELQEKPILKKKRSMIHLCCNSSSL